jgi:pSer/pThr/pTyr-binding forkhead associated (FHA) protein
MKLSLQVAVGKAAGKIIPVSGPEFVIGRDPDCHLRPASPIISKRHCALLMQEGRAVIKDFASTNGTLVNGERIEGEHELKNQDILKVGPLEFLVMLDLPEKVSLSKPTPVPAAKSEEDEAIAEMLLAMQDDSATPTPTATDQVVPEGSTVLDMPAVKPPEDDKPKPNEGLSKTRKNEKPAPTMNTQSAAEAILQKYSRRKR